MVPIDPQKGITFTGKILKVPDKFVGKDCRYDWVVATRNNTRYAMEVRQYHEPNIPDTVYFQQVDQDPLPMLEFPRGHDDAPKKGAQYAFNSAWDGTGQLNNLFSVNIDDLDISP